jgi:hypothetical protein
MEGVWKTIGSPETAEVEAGSEGVEEETEADTVEPSKPVVRRTTR